MFNLVPLAGPGRKMADRDRKSCFVRQRPRFQFPKPEPIPIAAAAICRDQYITARGIQLATFMTPPTANGGHRKTPCIMIRSHIDKTLVSSQIVDAVGKGSRKIRRGEIMTLYKPGRLGFPPLPAFVVIVPKQFLFLYDDAQHPPDEYGPPAKAFGAILVSPS